MSGRELTYDDAITLLFESDFEIDGRMPWSSNRTYLGHLTGEIEANVVYKPASGERPLWDFPQLTLCNREVAAGVVSEALGWRIVPPTVLRDGPFGSGMVQLFMHHDPDEHYFTLREEPQYDERFHVFAAFDIVINNADRKAGHCLRTEDGYVWGIDHGLSFHTEPKLRTVIWDYVGEPVAPDIADALCAFDGRLAGTSEVATQLSSLLRPDEVDALRYRIQRFVRAGRYPEPFTDYPYPWPMV